LKLAMKFCSETFTVRNCVKIYISTCGMLHVMTKSRRLRTSN